LIKLINQLKQAQLAEAIHSPKLLVQPLGH